MTAWSVRNQARTTSAIPTSADGPVASIVVIRSCPVVCRAGLPSMVITGVPLSSPSTFAVSPGCATENGSGAKPADGEQRDDGGGTDGEVAEA